MRPLYPLLILLCACVIAFQAKAQIGSLDASFGTNGIARTDFVPEIQVIPQFGRKIIPLSDGTYYLLIALNAQAVITHRLADGSIDISYRNNGYSEPVIMDPADLVKQNNGKMVIAGTSYTSTSSAFSLARYNTDGTLDESFDGDGKVQTPFIYNGINSQAYGRSVALQPDGKIVVAGYSYDNNGFGFTLARYNTDGSLDQSFDSDGKVRTDIIYNGTSTSAIAQSVVVQTDGKIVAAGYSATGYGYVFTLVRYNPDGSLDQSFEGDGKVQTAFVYNGTNSSAFIHSMALQSDGKLVATGQSYTGSGTVFTIARYNLDGSLDQSFDGDGKVQTAFLYNGTNSEAYAYSVAVQTDGKIITAGVALINNGNEFALARYNGDGSLDQSFDADGKVQTSFYNDFKNAIANSVAVQANGEIIAAGWSYIGTGDKYALARYNTDGSLDASFDGDGKLTDNIKTGNAHFASTTIQSDGKILAGGFSFTATGQAVAIARYNSNGTPDESFGEEGKAETSFGDNTQAFINSLAVQGDGKIVAACVQNGGSNVFSFKLVRYNADGSLDQSFDADGRVQTPFFYNGTDSYAIAHWVTLQPDGKIVAAGWSQTSVGTAFTIVRYNADGSLDQSFDGDGKVQTYFLYNGTNSSAGANTVVVQADGKIIAAGWSYTGNGGAFTLVRYNVDGSLDQSFNGNGKVQTFFDGGSEASINSLTLQPDGKIVAAGLSSDGSNSYHITVVRYNADGTLDQSFDGDGKVQTPIVYNDASVNSYANSVAVQPDGKILAAGWTYGIYNLFIVARYNTDGSLDQSFDGDGIAQGPTDMPNFNQGITISTTRVYAAGTSLYYGELASVAAFKLSDAPIAAGALNYDGSDDYVDLNTSFTHQNFTIEMWVKPGSTQQQWADIIDNNHLGEVNWVLQQKDLNTNNYYCFFKGLNSGETTNNFSLTPNVWQHVALVKSPTQIIVYVNGLPVMTHNLPENFQIYYTNSHLTLGRLVAYEGRNWNGSMDEVRMWNRPLCQEEIQHYMNNELPFTSGSGLLSYYKMNAGFVNANNADYTTLIDETGAHNGTLYNFALTGTTSNWIAGQATGTAGQLAIATWYRDQDGDQYGNAADSTLSCVQPAGYITDKTDCNDADADIYPNAPELCDGKDNDCNGQTDEGCPPLTTAGPWRWAKKPEGSVAGSTNQAISRDPAGNSYVTGSFTGTMTFPTSPAITELTSTGDADIFIAKYDANGNVLWAKRAGGAKADAANAVRYDGHGNLYIVGYFTESAGFDDKTLTNPEQNSMNIFIAKYEAATGNVLWAKQGAGPAGGDRAPFDVAVDAAGDAYFTGSYTGTITFAPLATITAAPGWWDIFVVKYNSAGDAQWAITIGSPEAGYFAESGNGIAVDQSGKVYITGRMNGSSAYPTMFGNIPLVSPGGGGFFESSFFLAKYNPSTTTWEWAVTGGGNGQDWGNKLSLDNAGAPYLNGYFEGTATFGSSSFTSAGSSDYFVAKYASDGKLLWIHPVEGIGFLSTNSSRVDAAGFFYFAGVFDRTITVGGQTLTSSGLDNSYIACWNSYGLFQWVKHIPGDYYSHVRSIDVAENGKLSYAGGFASGQTFDCTTLNSPNTSSLAVANMGTPGDEPSAPGIPINKNGFCSGTTVTYYLSGNLGNATEWKVYTDSCGGTLIGTGDSFTITYTETTTFYIRGEGGCIVPGECASHTQFVKSSPPPEATAQTFCNSDNQKVSDLVATGQNLKWYDSLTGGTQYSGTELLVTGNYYVSQTVDNCESERTTVAVTVSATITYFRDADDDGFGNFHDSTRACSLPPGYVTNSTDCNDNNAAIHPGTPVFTCPANRNVNLGANCAFTVPDLTTGLSATNNCSNTTFTQNPATGTTVNSFHNAIYHVTITATDDNGYSSYCDVVLTAKDTTRPTITAPAAKTVNTDVGACTANVALGTPVYADNCGGVAVGNNAPATFKRGVTTVTWTATDSSGNTATATQTITVLDNERPLITYCPTLPVLCYNTNNTYTVPAITATDNCGVERYNYTISGATTRSGTGSTGNASGIFNPGTSTIVWTAIDTSGNTASCSTIVKVDKVDVTMADVYASQITASIGMANTIYKGYGGTSITLTAQATTSAGPGTFSYKWTVGSPAGSGFATTQSITVSPTATTTYYVSVKDANNCGPLSQVSKQVKVVDITCGAGKIWVCLPQKKGGTISSCESSSASSINNLNKNYRGWYLGQCTTTITARETTVEQPNAPLASAFNITAIPNPTVQSFAVTIHTSDLKQPVRLRVVNIVGQVIEERHVTGTGQTISLGYHYRPGIYLVEAVQGDQRKTVKMIKLTN